MQKFLTLLFIFFTSLATCEEMLSEAQKSQFNERLKSYPTLYSIAVIGFGSGQSAENFFLNCQDVKLLVGFDKMPSQQALDYFDANYTGRFRFFEGTSHDIVPRYIDHLYPGQKFDLVYMDGDQTYESVTYDIVKIKYMSHEGTILWINDVSPDFSNEIGRALEYCKSQKIIKYITVHTSEDPVFGAKSWAEAKFHFGCPCSYPR